MIWGCRVYISLSYRQPQSAVPLSYRQPTIVIYTLLAVSLSYIPCLQYHCHIYLACSTTVISATTVCSIIVISATTVCSTIVIFALLAVSLSYIPCLQYHCHICLACSTTVIYTLLAVPVCYLQHHSLSLPDGSYKWYCKGSARVGSR